MNEKYQNKYRIPSARLQNWDYGDNAAYFITICTKDRLHFFGEIDTEMQSSLIGKLAEQFWTAIPNHFSFIELGNFVIMPNHTHGILIINKPVETRHCLVHETEMETDKPKSIGQQRFQNQGKDTISSIVGSYKSVVTKHAHKIDSTFQWQPRFHDHIIRDSDSFNNIQQYIETNAANWEKDKFFQ